MDITTMKILRRRPLRERFEQRLALAAPEGCYELKRAHEVTRVDHTIANN
jgi:hypothetical protein